jgi:hypothetical protein
MASAEMVKYKLRTIRHLFVCHLPVPNIAQLVERSTVDLADIEWSLVRFRVFGVLQ